MSVLADHPILQRKVRADDWPSQATGTYRKLQQAIDAGSTDVADLASFFVLEARIIYDIYTQWRRDTQRCLADKGVAESEIASALAHIEKVSRAGRPAVLADREKTWSAIAALGEALPTQPADQALRTLDELKELWRHLHDSEVDVLSGLFDQVITRFGEAALGEMYENWVIGDWFSTRYKRFDVAHVDWREAFPLVVYLTFESMHGHLAGPGRTGDVTFEEQDDAISFTFAPCGSGGRSVVGEPLDGTGPRMEAPYRWKVLEEEHPFAWNQKGVCTYCAHCCVLTEKLPIEHFGYPIRVVDPPLYPNDGKAVCRWTVYREPQAVPEAVYERLGCRKPPPSAPLGSAARVERDALTAAVASPSGAER